MRGSFRIIKKNSTVIEFAIDGFFALKNLATKTRINAHPRYMLEIREIKSGKLHCEDGPALFYNDQWCWHINGRLHREDGPAVVSSWGWKEWWVNGQRHRENGPAIVRPDGSEEWYFNGLRHREDGPAVIHSDGHKEWFLNGKSQDPANYV